MDVGDDGEFRCVILGAQAASDTGKPSALAKQFVEQTTGPDRPRVHRNALVLAVPSRDGLQTMRSSVRSLLGWEDVERQLRNQRVDPVRSERLRRQLQEARQRVPEMIRQAYSVVVTVNESNDIHAFKLAASAGPLFPEIKNDARSRIKETPVDAEALLPGGPYDLWRDDEDSHLVKDLASAFSRNPRLPKMLTAKIVLGTVLQGVERGLLVARLSRPDGTARTWWREPVDERVDANPMLEVVLPEKAELARLPEKLLAPSTLPGLWDEGRVSLRQALDYFSGSHVVNVPREGYEESLAIPECPGEAVRAAVSRSVEEGAVWLTSGPTSCCRELVPDIALDEGAVLRPPPDPVAPQEMTPESLPDAWENGETNGAALTRALSHARGENLPWGIVRDSIRAAVNARWLETVGNGNVVRDRFDAAGQWRLRLPEGRDGPPVKQAVGAVRLDPTEMQELAEQIPQLLAESAGFDLQFHLSVSIEAEAPENVRMAVDGLLEKVVPDLKSDTGGSRD